MSLSTGALLRLAVSPHIQSVTATAQRFPNPHNPTRAHLDQIPQAVVAGFEWALDSRKLTELERRIDLLAQPLHGFAYEGATMAYTITDTITRGHRARDLLQGPALPHLFLSYIGIGFAMARLPRATWGRVVPDIDAPPYHPTLSWLAVDGYAFDLAYFGHRRWASPAASPKPWPWMGESEYFPRCADQGLGRALWFIHGADSAAVAKAVQAFDTHRQGDLWSGVALAATFAGPEAVHAEQLKSVVPSNYAGDLACGSILAAAARVRAGHVPDHSQRAARVLTGLTCQEAAAIADESAPEGTVDGTSYEQWRANIRLAWVVLKASLATENI